VTDRKADANDSRSLWSQQNDGHYVTDSNRNCNHDLKNLFKGAAIVASSKPGPFQEFYTALLTKGIRPEMARLTLARKIATIVLMMWKKGVCFDAQHLKPQTA